MSPVLSVNVFTAPEKAMVGERVRPFGPPPAFDPMTSTLIFGENDAVLVDTLTTVAKAEALANWVALHHRNLATIYITHGHFDHFAGLSVLLQRFPQAGHRHAEVVAANAQAIASDAVVPQALARAIAG
jgi:glyoxylase-like metal-dependent hydrolase (beta-lactamase superfamily II)